MIPLPVKPFTDRELSIIDHARHYRDVVDPLFAVHGGGSGGAVPLMPPQFNWSFREFERVYGELRSAHPGWWRQFRARYITSTRVQKRIKRHSDRWLTVCDNGHLQPLPANWAVLVSTVDPGIAGRKHRGRVQPLVDATVVVEMWDSQVRDVYVAAAVRWIAREFRGTPCLPKDLREAA